MRRGVCVLACLVAGLFVLAGNAVAAGPLRTGFLEPHFDAAATQVAAFDRADAVGVTTVRLTLEWSSVATGTPADATDPNDPAYDWDEFDTQIQLAKARGLDPIVCILSAPPFASGADAWTTPDATELGKFATAAARRYDGSTPGMRVRYWQVWNEPNRSFFLRPQFDAQGRMVSADRYRALVRAMGNAVHGVKPDNLVVGGGLAPLGKSGNPAPLAFARKLLCVSRELRRTCDLRGNRLPIDVWSHHPYTSGGPTHRSYGRDDVQLGDLPKLRRFVQAAVRLGQIRPNGSLRFWVTEFSWDSAPPDPQALKQPLHARWTAEALYRMWAAGVTLATWWRVDDEPLATSRFQSGFWDVSGQKKASFQAFRFPTVALKRSNGIYVWVRTPEGKTGVVTVDVRRGTRWVRLGRPSTNAYGIVSKTFRTGIRRGVVRAMFQGERSIPFSLAYVGDRFVNPFGCGGPASPC